MEGDTHIHNNAPAPRGDDDGSLGVVIGVIIAVLVVIFLFMFGLPALRDDADTTDNQDINIDITPEVPVPGADGGEEVAPLAE